MHQEGEMRWGRGREKYCIVVCFEEKDGSLGWEGIASNGDIEKERSVSSCEECRNNKIEDRYDIVRLRREGLMEERERWEKVDVEKGMDTRVRRNGC